MDPTSGRKPIFSSSSFSSAEAAIVNARSGQECSSVSDADQAANEFIRKFREDLRLDSLAARAANVDEFKLKSFERSSRFLRKPCFEIDVDKSADEFINRFRENLKIERRESLENYMEMLNRGV